jgi:hypothetical protein
MLAQKNPDRIVRSNLMFVIVIAAAATAVAVQEGETGAGANGTPPDLRSSCCFVRRRLAGVVAAAMKDLMGRAAKWLHRTMID